MFKLLALDLGTYLALPTSMRTPSTQLALSALLLVGACTTQVGGEDEVSTADASVNDVAGPDAAPAPDAPPAFTGPCGEGDAAIVNNGNCYEYFFMKESWIGARLKCQALSGDLARVDDSLSASVLSSLVPSAFPEAWLLGTDAETEGTWTWAGPPLSYTQWRSGEPSNGGGNENCMVMIANAGGSWDDRACNTTLSYICERTAPAQ